MRVQLSGINDLIAAEGKYHLKCLVQFERKVHNHEKEESHITTDKALNSLCLDIENVLAKGHVYDMGMIWNKYLELSKAHNSHTPQQYLSRRQSFYTPQQYLSRRQFFYVDVKKKLGTKVNFVRPLDVHAPLLIYPGDSSEYVVSHSLTKGKTHELFVSSGSESSEELSSDESPQVNLSDTKLFQEMVHVALRLRADLDALPGHKSSWQNIDQKHVEKVIPDSLYLFLALLFGGTTVIDGFDDDESGTESDTAKKQKVFGIAQDIVFGMSDGKKLTPKHIGLGLTLHQVTRSESLVNVFHAANHCIPIWTVRSFDNAMANTVLDRYKHDRYVFIPEGIMPDKFVHCSFDNIDLLETTIDGNNTFHSTQLAVWQRKSGTSDLLPSLSSGIHLNGLDKEAMKSYHELDKAKQRTNRKPSGYPESFNINMATWLKENSLIEHSHAKNLCWVLARSPKLDEAEQVVSLWGTFNECSCIVQHPITNVGMLPILQAPADEYDTVTSVLNKFQVLTRRLGQTFTVVTADQPLYSKTKELIWEDDTNFKNVVVCMGGLHICFNFLRAIGQHMEYSGLEDVWVETGIFGQNTAVKVLEEKAYYRAVRGHLLTYEALWRLRWKYFAEWMMKRDVTQNVDPHIESLVATISSKSPREKISDSVRVFMMALQDQGLTDLLAQFDREMSSVKNFAYWMSYLRMVEVLLSFIRAQRTGDWLLHVQAFSAMLP